MISEAQIKNETVVEVARKMAVAARTAPKARGIDNLEIRIAVDQDLEVIAGKMEEIGTSNNQSFFLRDAQNIRNSEAIVLIGTRIKPINLVVCGLCGMQNCSNKNLHPEVPCAFNTNDLGIATGSAAGVAIDNRIDSRVMYTIGIAVKELKLFPEDVKMILGIALSATGKNIFFDRQH